MTQIELLIGLAITSLTLLAMAAFLFSASQAWKSADEVQGARVTSLQAGNRVQEMVRSAKYLGWAGSKSDGKGSALLFWRQDSNNDGRMQLGEIGLLEHDASQRMLTLVVLPSTVSNSSNLCDISDIDSEADVAEFKKLSNLKSVVLVKDVLEVNFAARDGSVAQQRPSLEYKIRNEKDGRVYGESQSVAVRAPRSKPVRCNSAANCACISSSCICSAPGACGCGGEVGCRTMDSSKCKGHAPTAFSTATETASTTN